MDFSSIASFLVTLARPLSLGACFGSSFGCLCGVVVARMQAVLKKPSNESEDASLIAPRRLIVSQHSEALGHSINTGTEADVSALGSMKLELHKREFVNLLQNFVGESGHLCNNPMDERIPEEKRAVVLVRDELDCFAQLDDGPLFIEEFEFEPGRTNLRVIYDVTGDPNAPSIAFAGAHFDVSPKASNVKNNTETDDCGLEGLGKLLGFDRCGQSDKVSFREEPCQGEDSDHLDKLYGRGTSSGLGHVALLTSFLSELARAKPRLRHSIHVFFFAGREGGEANVGADRLLDLVLEDIKWKPSLKLKKGSPVFWLDAGDYGICYSSTGSLGWTLKTTVERHDDDFRKDSPNSIELAYNAFTDIQRRFHERALAHAHGALKPTRIECSSPSSQAYVETVMYGDIRTMPSESIAQIMTSVEFDCKQFVDECLQSKAEQTEATGSPVEWGWIASPKKSSKPSRCVQEMCEATLENQDSPKRTDALVLAKILEGIRIHRETHAHQALVAAFHNVDGNISCFSVNGSIPHARIWQDHGFDVQICGFGQLDGMYTDDEHCSFKAMNQGYKVLCNIICLLEQTSADAQSPLSETTNGESLHKGLRDSVAITSFRTTCEDDGILRRPSEVDFLSNDDAYETLGNTSPTLDSTKTGTHEPIYSQFASVASWMQPRPWPLAKIALNKTDIRNHTLNDTSQKGIFPEFVSTCDSHTSQAMKQVVPDGTALSSHVESSVIQPSRQYRQRRHVSGSSTEDDALLAWFPFSWLWTDASNTQASQPTTRTSVTREVHEY